MRQMKSLRTMIFRNDPSTIQVACSNVKREEFTVDLPEAYLFFDTNQLGKGTTVEFELKAK